MNLNVHVSAKMLIFGLSLYSNLLLNILRFQGLQKCLRRNENNCNKIQCTLKGVPRTRLFFRSNQNFLDVNLSDIAL